MPTPKHIQDSIKGAPEFLKKPHSPVCSDLESEIRELRKEVAELKSLLSPPSSIILTGDAVTRFMRG